MTTPLSNPREYKVTFAGPHYAIGDEVRIASVWRPVFRHDCDAQVQVTADGLSCYQFQWVYFLGGDEGEEVGRFIEADMMLFEKKGDLRHAATE